MDQKRALTAQFQERKGLLSVRHRNADDMIDGVLGGGGISNTTNKRPKFSSSYSSISTSTSTHSCGFSTPGGASASTTTAPTESVSFTTTASPTTAVRTEGDGGCNGNDENEEEEYADCTYDIREYFQPPPPLVFPTVDDDDADE